MNTLIVTGGTINENFLKEYVSNNKYDNIIAVDKGLNTLNKLQIKPNYIIGDFDSVNTKILQEYENKNIPSTYLKPEKDFTDTHMALKKAVEMGSKEIIIIGAIGTRLDHTFANIHILKEALDNDIEAKLVNENNEIMLIKNKIIINKNNNFKYISIIPLTTEIKEVTLKGFKYQLQDACLEIGESIGVSNEQIENKATIEIKEGIAILILSKD